MKEGMLWRDDLTGSIQASIQTAAVRYLTKYGRPPNRCHVHPDVLGKVQIIPLEGMVGGVIIVPDGKLRPHELWIGFVEEDERD